MRTPVANLADRECRRGHPCGSPAPNRRTARPGSRAGRMNWMTPRGIHRRGRASERSERTPARVARSATLFALLLSLVPSATATDNDAIQTWSLPDGTAVLLLEDHRAPLVNVTIEFPAGSWSPWAQENHAREAFAIQLDDPGRVLRSRADRLSVDLSASMGPRSATISGSCLSQDLGQLLALARDVMANRDFDEKELVRWRKARRIDWEARLKSPHFRLDQATARLLFADGDPRRRGVEPPDDVETDALKLLPVRDTILRLPGRVIAVAGSVTRAALEPLIASLLPPMLGSDDANAPPGLPEIPPDGLAPAFSPLSRRDARPERQTVTMPRLTQVYFALTRESLEVRDDDYPAFLLVNHVLGGHFFSRMYVTLRHEGGETYGASASSSADIEPNSFSLTTFTRTDNAAATEAKLREVLATLHEGGITEDERAAAASFMLGRRPFARQHPNQLLSRRRAETRRGLPSGFYDELTDRAAALTLDEINAFVKRYYDPAAFTMLRVETK